MSLFIVASQSCRIAAIWAKRQTTKQVLLTVSVVAYSLLLVQRENKISKYYANRHRADREPESLGR